MTIEPGRRDSRLRFERRRIVDDGAGNTRASWDDPQALCTVWAAFRPVFGREQLAAGSLASTLTGTLTVQRSSLTAGITAADRAVFVTGPWAGTIGNIRSIVPTPDGADIEMLIEAGLAT